MRLKRGEREAEVAFDRAFPVSEKSREVTINRGICRVISLPCLPGLPPSYRDTQDHSEVIKYVLSRLHRNFLVDGGLCIRLLDFK